MTTPPASATATSTMNSSSSGEPQGPNYGDFLKDPDYYFPSGDICIAAGETLFRLHRDALSRHSQVFKDMFSMASSASQQPSLDGVPIVTITENAVVAGAFFGMIYDAPDDFGFDILENIVYMAHKYDAERIMKWAITCLITYYPSIVDRQGACTLYTDPKSHLFTDPSFLVRLINVTVLVDDRRLDNLAATAYYSLSFRVKWDTQSRWAALSKFRDPDNCLTRLETGKQRFLSRPEPVAHQVITHYCPAQTYSSSESCRRCRDSVALRLLGAVKEDFLGYLATRIDDEFPNICHVLRAILGSATIKDCASGILEDYGFRSAMK